VIYPILAMMALSVTSGFFVFGFGRRFQRWIDSPSRAKRWLWRALLFFASFLAPMSLVLVCEQALFDTSAFHEALLALPWLVRLCVFLVPLAILWWWLYRGLLKHYRSEMPEQGS
jgi:hypothetical protein